MSLLVEIANRADVPLEAVVRVLTREPVSDADHARVLAVLDSLDAEQTRVLERFALAAVHDTLPPPQPVLEARVIEPERADEPRTALQSPPAGGEPAPLVQLGAVLSELTDAIRDLRRETDTERRERVDDLAVLIDLITKGWEGLDRRLGRLERQLARLDTGERTARALPAPVEPVPAPVPPEPGPPEPPPPPPDANGRSRFAGRLPLVAVLLLGVGVGAVAALDLPNRSDVSTVVSASTREEPTTGGKAPSPPPTAPPTSSVLGEVATKAKPKVAPETKPDTSPATTAKRPAATTARPRTTAATRTQAPTTAKTTPTRTAAPSTPGFRPSRTWAWPPVDGADYYLVEFFRAGQRIYRGRPTRPQLRLPASVAFTPGAYRWSVRPGFGDPAENELRAPIVDSGFTVGD